MEDLPTPKPDHLAVTETLIATQDIDVYRSGYTETKGLIPAGETFTFFPNDKVHEKRIKVGDQYLTAPVLYRVKYESLFGLARLEQIKGTG